MDHIELKIENDNYHRDLVLDRLKDYEDQNMETTRLGNPCITKRKAIELAKFLKEQREYIVILENKIDSLKRRD